MWIPILLTHWGRVTHIFVGKLTIIGPDNGLSPGRRQAIIWTNARIVLIGPWGTNFSEIFIYIQAFSFKKMHLKMSSAKWRPFCLGLNVLRQHLYTQSAPATNFTDTFSITIHIWWESSFPMIPFLIMISLPIFAYLSCNVQKVVAIAAWKFGWEQNEISITSELWWKNCYHQIYWYKSDQISKLKCFSFCLAIVFAHSIEARCKVENEDVVGAATTGDAPTTSEWLTMLYCQLRHVLY